MPDGTGTESPPRTAPVPGRRLRWAWRVIMLAAAATSIMMFRNELPDAGSVWRVIGHASPGWLALAVAAQLASMGMFARVQRRLLQAGGVRMSLPRAIRMTYAGNALSTTLPAGPAVSVAFNFRQYRRAGAQPQLATAVILLGGVIMTAGYAAVGLMTLLAEPHSRAFATSALAVLSAVVAAIAVSWRRPGTTLARGVRWARRAAHPVLRHRLAAPLAEQALRGGRSLRLRPADWIALTLASLFNWLFDIVSLAAAGRAVGVHAAPYAIAIAYFAAQAAGSLLPLLPGGLGAMEGSLAASLVAFGTLSAPAGAAVALYRLVSFWGVVGAGWLAWLAVKIGEEGGADSLRALSGVRAPGRHESPRAPRPVPWRHRMPPPPSLADAVHERSPRPNLFWTALCPDGPLLF